MNKNLVFKVGKMIVICSLFIIGLIALVCRNSKPIILGYVFGASISILSFYLINDTSIKLVNMEPFAAKRKAYANYMIRFSIYFIVLMISILADYLNVLGTLIGLTMVKNSIYILIALDKDFLN